MSEVSEQELDQNFVSDVKGKLSHNNDNNQNEISDEPKFSKKQLKRKMKEAQWEINKKLKKENVKIKKKLKREQNKQNTVNNSTTSSSQSDNTLTTIPSIPAHTKLRNKSINKHEYLIQCNQNFSVIIDCAFEEYHNEKSMKSVGQQILFCYGLNRHSISPVHLTLSGKVFN